MRIRQLAFWLTLVAGACNAQAEDRPQTARPIEAPWTLERVLAAARDNLDVAIAGASADIARAEVRAADHAPLPLLTAKTSSVDLQNGLGGGNLLREKRIDKSLGLDWTWERGGKRALRTLAAQRTADAAAAEWADMRLQQEQAALAAYVDLLAAQQRIEELDAVGRSAAQLAEIAQRRMAAGDVPAQEANRAHIEAQRARLDAEAARLDRQRAALALASRLGRAAPADPAALSVDDAWPPLDASDTPIDVAAMIDRRFDVRAATLRAEAAQAARDTALAGRRADVTWGASIDHFPGTSTRQLELRLQVPLAWGYEQQGEIARADAVLAQAQQTLIRTRLLVENDLQRLQRETTSQADRVRAYLDDIVPRARRAAEQAERAYGQRGLSLSDLLDTRRTLRNTLLEALAARADHARAQGAWQLRRQEGLAP